MTQKKRPEFRHPLALAVALGCAAGAAGAHDFGGHGRQGSIDFGVKAERLLEASSGVLFGIARPLAESAPPTSGAYRTEQQPAAGQVALARGLKVRYLTRKAGNHTDMMAFWPDDMHATHLITCVEGGTQTLADGRRNPSVQRIDLRTGEVQTILRGLNRCDGIRRTGWGTILATEENDEGAAWEIIDPLHTTGQTVTDRGAPGFPAAISDASGSPSRSIVKRTSLPTMAWEGLTVLSSGVVIGGDELRPGSYADVHGDKDTDGGAIFKFVPDSPRLPGSGWIADLGESPLATGSTFAMQVSCQSSKQQTGQGCEVGNAAWVAVDAANARTEADAKNATGYYRPEDLHRDPVYAGEGVRFCWTATGNEGTGDYAEVNCAIDREPLTAGTATRTVVVNRFVEGDTDFNSFDNLAFQPNTGNLYVIEDHPNGDIFACLPDGADRDIKSDGCVKVLSVKDTSAEPTGFIFSGDGRRAYLSIQHSDDSLMPEVDGYPTDDVLEISGFGGRPRRHR